MDMPYNRQLHFENSGVLLIALADKIAKSFGGRVLYSGATLQLNAGERWALVGPNGAGKTTLLKIIMGQETPMKERSPLRAILPSAILSKKQSSWGEDGTSRGHRFGARNQNVGAQGGQAFARDCRDS